MLTKLLYGLCLCHAGLYDLLYKFSPVTHLVLRVRLEDVSDSGGHRICEFRSRMSLQTLDLYHIHSSDPGSSTCLTVHYSFALREGRDDHRTFILENSSLLSMHGP